MVYIFLGIFCLLIILGFELPLLNQSVVLSMEIYYRTRYSIKLQFCRMLILLML